jgi:hypothetical protein
MQKFSIEVNAPTEITLTDNDHFEQKIVFEIKTKRPYRGFIVTVKEMTDGVSICNDDGEFENEFTFDKKAFEERMEKLRSG